MILSVIVFFTAVFLAYTNGANDNFKGVATLYGSKTLNFKNSLYLGTILTFAGALVSIYFSTELVKIFSGKGLVPDEIAIEPAFLFTVGLAAAGTVLIATLSGFPISTTHSLTGALLGAGLIATDGQANFSILTDKIITPLVLGPIVAVILCVLVYFPLHRFKRRWKLAPEACLCIERAEPVRLTSRNTVSFIATKALPWRIRANESACLPDFNSQIKGLSIKSAVKWAHMASGALVSFARGLNDTPKIVGLIVTIQLFDIQWGLLAIALGMAAGGLLNAAKVARTMSEKITSMTEGQGFSANFVTGLLVLFASKFGLAVSTTHVSVGAIFGIGLINKKADIRTINSILLSWLLTLPVAIGLSAAIYWMIGNS
ncbi:MAG: anion permease [Calditrichaeota bacterium]|nr:MAG: anion permease [Calditrichota bacterium]